MRVKGPSSLTRCPEASIRLPSARVKREQAAPVRILSRMAAYTNIAAVARRTGVPSETLRKWEQRYGVLRPTRSPGGHRRYTDVDVRRVEWLKARLEEGYRIGEAAAMLGGDAADVAESPAELRDGLYDALAAADVTRVRS